VDKYFQQFMEFFFPSFRCQLGKARRLS